MLRVVLIVSLSVNIFLFSSLAMYGTWLAFGWLLSDFWRGITSLFVWIGTFAAGATAFWRIMDKLSATSSSTAGARNSL